MQHVRVYVQNEGAGEEEAVQSVQHNQQSPSPALSQVMGSTAIITFNLTDCYQQYQLLTCRYTSEDLAYSVHSWLIFDTKYKLVREKGFRIYINYQWIYHTGPSYWTYWIHFDYVPVPEVLDLVANTMECVDHLVQTLEKRYSSLHMIFMQFKGQQLKNWKISAKWLFPLQTQHKFFNHLG